MIEVNLIPDVKREFIRAQRMRNLVVSGSVLVALAAAAIVTLLAVILGIQAGLELLADNSIKSDYARLRSVDNLDNAVTIQNQLTHISSINDGKNSYSRIFDVIGAITPAAPNDVHISTIDLNPQERVIMIEGSAVNSYTATDVFKKTILNTTVEFDSGDGEREKIPLTDEVLLSDTAFGEDTSGARVLRFTLSFAYPEELFAASTENVSIASPTSRIDVTDSRLHVPDSLFVTPPSEEGEN